MRNCCGYAILAAMTPTPIALETLGWSSDLAAQIGADEGDLVPLRLSGVERSRATGLGEAGAITLQFPPGLSAGEVAVGDWVLAEPASARISRVLDRRSLLTRKAAGTDTRTQLIAANVDTLFIVSSCNADFNPARLERYVALALDAGVSPVIVLTKADLAADAADYLARARAISPHVEAAVTVNAKSPDAVAALGGWCGPGKTVAFAGSSGVGKSTLVNAMTGLAIATQGIREDDAKGRHTTTARALHLVPGGGMVIDMPGMRELALIDATEGIAELFDDIEALAATCRFRDCAHEHEPGCAIRAAVAAGTLDAARLGRWQKLRREDEAIALSKSEARRKGRVVGRMIKSAKQDKARLRE
ncbi:ribosome small subunit-dependent GTPase A [Phaeovulum sp.]|uniref:ribosome small subunit-dependent GTPase A n=1 Tax=Phaeovulum sp. TaxID=2934796 RepID=UPI0035675182